MFVTSDWVAHVYNLCEGCVHVACVNGDLSQDGRHYFEHGKNQGYVGWVRLIHERRVKRFIELVESMECDKCRKGDGSAPASQVAP